MTTRQDEVIRGILSKEAAEAKDRAFSDLVSRGILSPHRSWLDDDPEEDRMRELFRQKCVKRWPADSSTESQKSPEKNSREGPKGPTSDE
ncbi:MAG: hypothetical protein KDF64_03990 [Geminicoccaceae bacterium]|nr:hypothetical protein [Geminicoccaceae bacterium]